MSGEFIHDPEIRAQVLRDGFAHMPLLNSEDVAELLAGYREITPPMAPGFYTTLWSADLQYRRRVHETIRAVLDRRLKSLLRPAKYVLTQFVVKQGGHADTACPLHQDWSMTDESQHPCVSIWCPLVDVSPRNGPLSVVPGSQRVASHVRPNMPGSFYYSPVAPLYDTFRMRFLRELPMKAGNAIVYNGAITHGSRPNASPADRVAVVAAFVPEGKQLLHYWMESRDQVEVFAVGDDFYREEVVLGRRPSESPLIEVIQLSSEEPVLTEAAFLARTSDVNRNPIIHSLDSGCSTGSLACK